MTIHIACRMGSQGAIAVRISQPHDCIANAKTIQKLDFWKLWIKHYIIIYIYNPGNTFPFFSGLLQSITGMPLGCIYIYNYIYNYNYIYIYTYGAFLWLMMFMGCNQHD